MRGNPGVVKIQHNKHANVFFVALTKEICDALGIHQPADRQAAKWQRDPDTGRIWFELWPNIRQLDDGVTA